MDWSKAEPIEPLQLGSSMDIGTRLRNSENYRSNTALSDHLFDDANDATTNLTLGVVGVITVIILAIAILCCCCGCCVGCGNRCFKLCSNCCDERKPQKFAVISKPQKIVHDDHAPLLVTNRDDCPPYETVVRV